MTMTSSPCWVISVSWLLDICLILLIRVDCTFASRWMGTPRSCWYIFRWFRIEGRFLFVQFAVVHNPVILLLADWVGMCTYIRKLTANNARVCAHAFEKGWRSSITTAPPNLLLVTIGSDRRIKLLCKYKAYKRLWHLESSGIGAVIWQSLSTRFEQQVSKQTNGLFVGSRNAH